MRTISIAAMLLMNVVLNVVANIGFKQSAISLAPRGFFVWQIVGNVSGFLGVLALTYVMRFVPLSRALAFSWGLGLVAVEIVGARVVFHEGISLLQWGGVALVGGGLTLIALGRAA